jgi:hypothetical protein
MIYGEQRSPVRLIEAWDEKIGPASPYPQWAGEPKEPTGKFLFHDPLKEGKKHEKIPMQEFIKRKGQLEDKFLSNIG